MYDFPLKIAPGDDLSFIGFAESTEDNWFLGPGFILDLQCLSSDNWRRIKLGLKDAKSAGYSRIKETIDMVPISKVPYYLPGKMKNISCFHSEAMGIHRTIYSRLIRDQLRQEAIHLAKQPALPSLDRSPSCRKLLLKQCF